MSGNTGISDAEVSEYGSWRVMRVAEATSTNTELLAMAESGHVTGRTAMIADHQTAGRGRLDRRWDAPPGANLLVSLLFDDVGDPAVLTQAVGLAAVLAVESFASNALNERLGLKWPNDLLVDGRKLAGVLAQRSARGPIVVGVGLNVGWAPPGAASMAADLSLDVAPIDVLHAMLDELRRIDALLGDGDNTGEFAAAFRSRMLTIGQNVRIELPGDELLVGRAVDVEGDGRLLVEAAEDGALHRLDVGDVVHLRPARGTDLDD